MGNCLGRSEKLTAEIVPRDGAKVYPTVRLHGSPKSVLAAYIRFALLHKAVSLDFVPSGEAERVGGSEPEGTVTLQVGSEVVSGSRETLLRFIDTRFPGPSLGGGNDEATSLLATLTRVQHTSMLWHVERMVKWAEDLTTRGGKKTVDPSVGTPRMEIRKFARSYSELLEVMMEHAQMEETVLFPIFDKADRGVAKAAKEEHARDLPLMNGIKEVIKSVGVLDSGSPDYREALYSLSTRLKSLQGQCKQHFAEEEVELLPLMEALELSKEQEVSALEQCFEVMQGTHSRLFKFLLEGLPPHDAMKYVDLISKCRDKERMESMLQTIVK
ncbi:hemerythrin/HHE cation-binding motif [Spatholobus suberectus]|nr:hemerythrin/HHE cation-binding motif [Spatholobus suberectus]